MRFALITLGAIASAFALGFFFAPRVFAAFGQAAPGSIAAPPLPPPERIDPRPELIAATYIERSELADWPFTADRVRLECRDWLSLTVVTDDGARFGLNTNAAAFYPSAEAILRDGADARDLNRVSNIALALC